MKTNSLATYICSFLQDYLTIQKGFSRHTILSYRDTIKLLLTFSAVQKNATVTKLTSGDLTPDTVVAFLNHLEKQRGNSISTRNVRLACIHSLFRFLANRDPLTFDNCQRILAIPFKRARCSTVEYLEREEMKALLEAIDRSNLAGERDYTLFTLMHNTGARVQEVVDLRVQALQLERPSHVRFFGKGGKERLCPLWPDTVRLLSRLLDQRMLDRKANAPVFVNNRGQALTRFGVRYLLTKYVRIAAEECGSLKRKQPIHPHTIRHTTAMHLIQSGVDINTVRAWLGHVRLETTNHYARLDLDMKRKVLKRYLPVTESGRPWKQNQPLIQWLESL